MRTYLDPEEYAYPNGAMARKGRAVVKQNPHNPISLPYGEARAVRAGIPDTFSSIPARLRHAGKSVKGYLTYDGDIQGGDYAISFFPEADPARCAVCAPGEGCKKGGSMLVNSPATREIPDGKVLLAEYGNPDVTTNLSRVDILDHAHSAKLRAIVYLRHSTPGWEQAGSCARWTNGWFAVTWYESATSHGQQYPDTPEGESKAREHFARLTEES